MRRFAASKIAPDFAAMGRSRDHRQVAVGRRRRGRPALPAGPRRVRRRRRRLPAQCRRDRGIELFRLRRPRHRLLRAQRRLLRLFAQLRHPGAKEEMAAAHGDGRNRLRHRDDRTRHRQRPAGHPHPRVTRWRRVRDIGPEDLHLQRADVRSRHRRGQDQPGRRLTGNESRSGRDRPARIPPRPQPRKARASLLRYIRIVLRQRARSRQQSAGSRRRRDGRA